MELVETHGMKWMKIAEFFQNRGPIKLKNRYYGHIIRKNLLDSLKLEIQQAKCAYSNFPEPDFSVNFEFVQY